MLDAIHAPGDPCANCGKPHNLKHNIICPSCQDAETDIPEELATLREENERLKRALSPDAEPQFVQLWVAENQENDRLRDRVAELEGDLAKSKRVATSLDEGNRELRQLVGKIRSVRTDDSPWCWAGDGYDHLHSMGDDMVVRITAADLRTAIAKGEPT